MSGAKALLQRLGTPGITDITLVSGQAARCNEGRAALDALVRSTDDILQILFEAGGSRHVDTLGPKPSHWTARVDGVGVVEVQASLHGEIAQARFALRQSRVSSPTPLPAQAPLPPPPKSPLAPPVRPAPPLGPPARMTPIAAIAPMPRARMTPIAPEPRPLSDSKPTTPARPAVRPAASEINTSEIAFDFALDEAAARRSPVMPPPPMRLPLDTPFTEHAPYTGPGPRAVARVPISPGAAFKELLLAARGLNASDLHLVAGRPPAYRLAGELTPRGEPIDAARLAQMVLPRVPARLLQTLEEHGSADFALEEPGAGRFRVNVGRQRTGLKAAFRLIPSVIPTLAALGLPEAIGLATHHHQGLIVITGPTGHGKTTTLAAIVDILNRETARHVITVEDPVELVHPRKKAMMSQREVGTHTRSFQSALKASLREDPDVIVVGELRDTETVRMALSASETGHLVIGTMNTPSAAKTIDRIIDLFPPGDQAQVRVTLAGGLRLVVGQRLLPSADRTQLVAAAELLPGSIALWNLIRDSRTFQIPSLQQRGKSLGILRLDDSLAALVQSGRTTLEIAMGVAEAPGELEARVNGTLAPLGPPRPGSFTSEAEPSDRVSAVPSATPSQNPNPPKQGFLERAGALLGKRGG